MARRVAAPRVVNLPILGRLEIGPDGLPVGWQSWDPDVKRRLVEKLQARQARARAASWRPYPWQHPHLHPDGWDGPCTAACLDLPEPELEAQGAWLLMGGRGTGKTDGAAHYVLEHVNGPACDPKVRGGHRVTIVAPTLGDAVASCIIGASGLQAYDPRVQHVTSAGGTYARFPNGTRARLLGANTPNDVERLRAETNKCLVWLEEAGAMRQLGAAIAQSRPGLRLGHRPHFVASTTPRVKPELVKLLEHPGTILTRGRTADAHHLDAAVREALYREYGATTTGRQELDGELLTDITGALWKRSLIDAGRIDSLAVPELSKVVVAVDPNAGGADEAGIVVVGISAATFLDDAGFMSRHGYVLEDCSGSFESSAGWAAQAVSAYHRHGADAIVAEVNNGGDMVGLTVRTADPTVRYRAVNATRGKARRAEPVVQLYEQGRMHHVHNGAERGGLARLEDQMTTWTEAASWSPDRMDALVWGATDLLVKSTTWLGGVV